MKVFIGLSEISGYYHNLYQGFLDLGIESIFLDLEYQRFSYQPSDNLKGFLRLVQVVSIRRSHTPRSKLLQKIFWKILELFLRLPLFLWAIVKYDTFIFAAHGKSFFYFLDLPILHLLNKRIIYVFSGSDGRPPYINGAFMTSDIGISIESCIPLTQQRKRMVGIIERWAHVVVSHPNYAQFHTRPFVHYSLIGFPYSFPNVDVEETQREQSIIVRILHSPSRPVSKGSFVIREVINRLQARGLAIEFVEIRDKPNSEVLSELRKCDFVVDQLYSDIFISGFGTEAAFCGKAVVIGGYGLEQDRKSFPPECFPPVYLCHPDDIESAIEKLVLDADYRNDLGKRAQDFVRTYYAPVEVAKRFVQLIQNNISHEWICDPYQIRYWHGYGLPEDQLRNILARMIQSGGKKALQLVDKSELEQIVIDFAGIHD